MISDWRLEASKVETLFEKQNNTGLEVRRHPMLYPHEIVAHMHETNPCRFEEQLVGEGGLALSGTYKLLRWGRVGWVGVM